MITFEIARFTAMLIIVLTIWRLVQTKLVADDSTVGKAMAFIV